jgi:hypothetical protein
LLLFAAILGVRASGDRLGKTAHQPRQIAQASTQFGQIRQILQNT